MRKKGVDLRVGAKVRALERRRRRRSRVVLGDGSALVADTVLYATGRAPEHRRARPRGGRRRARRQRRGPRRRPLPHQRAEHLRGRRRIDRVQLTPVALAEAMALVDDLFGGAQAQESRPCCRGEFEGAISCAASSRRKLQMQNRTGIISLPMSPRFRSKCSRTSGSDTGSRQLLWLPASQVELRRFPSEQGADAAATIGCRSRDFAFNLQCHSLSAQFLLFVGWGWGQQRRSSACAITACTV